MKYGYGLNRYNRLITMDIIFEILISNGYIRKDTDLRCVSKQCRRLIDDYRTRLALNFRKSMYKFDHDFPNVKELVVFQMTDPESSMFTDHILQKVESLDLSWTNISSLTFIKNFNALTYLKLDWTNVCDISNVCVDNLVELHLQSTKVTDISVLSNAYKLQKLNISFTAVKDINSLSNCTNLTHLSLKSSRAQDISALSHCRKLRYLNLHHCINIRDYSPLNTCPELHDICYDILTF